jgi:hypothetical protein
MSADADAGAGVTTLSWPCADPVLTLCWPCAGPVLTLCLPMLCVPTLGLQGAGAVRRAVRARDLGGGGRCAPGARGTARGGRGGVRREAVAAAGRGGGGAPRAAHGMGLSQLLNRASG